MKDWSEDLYFVMESYIRCIIRLSHMEVKVFLIVSRSIVEAHISMVENMTANRSLDTFALSNACRPASVCIGMTFNHIQHPRDMKLRNHLSQILVEHQPPFRYQ